MGHNRLSSGLRVLLVLQRRLYGGGSGVTLRRAERRLWWERRARSLRCFDSLSHSSNASGPNRSRGSISRTTRYTCGLVIRGIFFPPRLLQPKQERSGQQAQGYVVMQPAQLRVSYSSSLTSPFSVSNSVSMYHLEPPTYARVSKGVSAGALDR